MSPFTPPHANRQRASLPSQLIYLGLLLCVALLLPAAGYAEVALESPRGNYEGADNIHWYQQTSLKYEDYASGIPSVSEEYVCNSGNSLESCAGYPIELQTTMYHAQGTVPFNLAIWVDDLPSEGFSYPWRRALREVRRINDALSRSGVNTRVYVAAIEFKNMDHLSGDAVEIWEYYSGNHPEATRFARDNEADALMIIRNGEFLNTGDYCGVANVGPNVFWLPVMVLTCADDFAELFFFPVSTVAAHEFGHLLGLGHNKNDPDSYAFLPHGFGHYDEENRTNTIMSQVGFDPTIPIFSSPHAQWNGERQGDEKTADATAALNDAAATAALFYENKWGHLAKANGAFSKGITPLRVPPPPIGVP